MSACYLDYNATHPLLDAAQRAMATGHALEPVNARAVYGRARRAQQMLAEARERVGSAVGARPSECTFTSGATEGNALAVQSAVFVARKGSRVLPRLLVGSTEHASIWGPIRALSELQLCEWTTVPVDTAGRPDLEVLSRLLPSCDGLFLMSANNETGVQTPLDGVSALVGDAGVPWHCDMVQSLGKAAVDLGATEARGITSAAFSAHKLGGPKGVGGLFARRGSNFISGMGQREIRPGTPNLSGALGFAAACAAISLPSQETVRGLREAWEEVLLAEFPGVQIHGRAANRLPNTTMASFKDPAGGWIDGEEVTLALAQAGVEVSTGAACSTGSGQPSHVLLAMGIPPEIAHASLRLSLGTATTHEDLAIFKHALRATLQPTS